MFVIEEIAKPEDQYRELCVGDYTIIKSKRCRLVEFDSKAKAATFFMTIGDMDVTAKFYHLKGDSWINSEYSSPINLILKDDKIWVGADVKRQKEIAIGRNFSLRIMSQENGIPPSRVVTRFIGFVQGFMEQGGIISYTSFTNNTSSNAMLFMGQTGLIYAYDKNGNWYMHKNDKMVKSNIKYIETHQILKWEA